MHQHGLDQCVVAKPVQRLFGQAAIGDPNLRVADGVEPERLAQRATQPDGQGSDRGYVRPAAVVPGGIGDLAGAVRRLALGAHPIGEIIGRETGQSRSKLGRHRPMLPHAR